MSDIAHSISGSERPFRVTPLLVANMACTMAMMAFMSLIGPIARVVGLSPWQVGLTVTVGGVMWLILARPWGVASDRVGRRAVLLAGAGGFALSYWALCVLIGWSINMLPSSSLIFAGLLVTRLMMGVFCSAVPTAGQALIADNIAPHERTRAMASLGAANAIGLIVGPATASLLVPYGLVVPLYFTAALPLVAFAALWWGLPRQPPVRQNNQAASKFFDRRLWRAAAVAFVTMSCVDAALITVGFFTLDRLGASPSEAGRIAGIALTVVGVALALSQLAVHRLAWSPQRLIRVGGVVASAGLVVCASAWSPSTLWLGHFVVAAGMGFVFPAFPVLAANAVADHEQGAAAGATGAAQGLGIVVGPFAATALYAVSPGAPYLIAALAMLVMALWPGSWRELRRKYL